MRPAQLPEAGHPTSIGRMAERAAHRLPGMGLAEQREVLALLGVRVTVLVQTTNPALRIEGELPGGGDLFPVTPGDPDGGPDRPRTSDDHSSCGDLADEGLRALVPHRRWLVGRVADDERPTADGAR